MGRAAKRARKADRPRSRPSLLAGRVFALLLRLGCRPCWWEWTGIKQEDVAGHCKQRCYREGWVHPLLRHPDWAAATFELAGHGLRFAEAALRQYGINPEAFRCAAEGMATATVHAAWQLVHIGSVYCTAAHHLPISKSSPEETCATQLAALLTAVDAEWRDCGAVPVPEMLEPEAAAEDDNQEAAPTEGDEQQGQPAEDTGKLDASIPAEVLPGVPKEDAKLAAFLKERLRLPANWNVKDNVLKPIRSQMPRASLAEVLERAVRRIAYKYRRGLRLCQEHLAPRTPLAKVRRRLGVRRGHKAGEQLAAIVHEHGAVLVGLLVPGLRHPRPHVIKTSSLDPKAGQAIYNWSNLRFEPEEALAFYSGRLSKTELPEATCGNYQLEAAPGSLVGTFKRSVWVQGDLPPQRAEEQRAMFGGKLLMDPQHWEWPGAWAHVANDSLRADLANLVVHESLVMAALPDAAFGRFTEGVWWYGPTYWAGKSK